MADQLPWLSERQWRQLAGWLADLQLAETWHGGLPVALLERPWLRLRSVTVAELARVLPPDASAEAPELERYRQLTASGMAPWTAQLRCWEEFGQASCQAAQRRFWLCQEQRNQNWNLERYTTLIRMYRTSLDQPAPRRLPLLVLAEADGNAGHQLHWLHPQGRSIRHTCA